MESNALKNMASSKKDFAWQWTKDLDLVTKHFYCVFCNHKCTGSISRFKHHLGGVSLGGMISCKKVPPNAKEECFANVMGTKEKRKASHDLCLVVKVSTWAQQGHHIHEYRTWMLKEEVENVQSMMKEHQKAWKRYGCTIMSDGWLDGKSRCLINFLVNSLLGTWFLKSVWWTSFAVHCIDLMLEDISKMTWFDDTLKRARCISKYLYGHQWALQQRSKKRRKKYDPIVVEEIASNDEWITEIENPILLEDPTWLKDKLLYNVEAVRNMSPPIYEGGPYIREPRESSPPPPWGPITYKRKRDNEESSS
ncbi:unnamed protein product [Malus baccata var. baccata]